MKVLRYGLAMVILAAMVTPSLAAQSSWNICINPATDLTFIPGEFAPGGFVTVAANIYPDNSIPVGGVAPDCSGISSPVVGTFYANVGLELGTLPAAPDVEGFVTWQFDFSPKGTFATIGIVPLPTGVGQTYIQTLVGSSGQFQKRGNGQVRVKSLDSSGFQFRISLPPVNPGA